MLIQNVAVVAVIGGVFFFGLATKLIHQNKKDKHACLLNQLELGSSENRFVGCLVDDKKNSYTFVQTVH